MCAVRRTDYSDLPLMPPAQISRLSPRKRPRQERAQQTVDALLQATAQVLSVRGWAGTTTNHIAKRAGVSIGTLYEYFPSKNALVNALMERHLDEAESRLSDLATGLSERPASLEAVVQAIVAAMVELHAASPRLHYVLFEEAPQTPSMQRRIRRMEDTHTRTFADILPRLVSVADPDVSARVVVEVLETVTHRWIVSRDAEPLPRHRMQQELERLVLGYLRGQ